MSKYTEKILETSVVLLAAAFVFVILSVLISIFYKEVLKPEPPVECRSGKLFEVTTRDNITVYEPTYDDCEVKH